MMMDLDEEISLGLIFVFSTSIKVKKKQIKAYPKHV